MQDRRIIILAAVHCLTMLPLLSGCFVTRADLLPAKLAGNGTTRLYPVTENQAWDLAIAASRWEGWGGVLYEHRNENYIDLWSQGNLVPRSAYFGVWIELEDKESTKGTIVIKRALENLVRIELNPKNFTEESFHARFAHGVAITKKGAAATARCARFGGSEIASCMTINHFPHHSRTSLRDEIAARPSSSSTSTSRCRFIGRIRSCPLKPVPCPLYFPQPCPVIYLTRTLCHDDQWRLCENASVRLQLAAC
jgi:hypothetical protein